ncbi:MAG: MFS transporter [Erysipelotrichaceae bacterium]|nr:MFS transporter [Erysipelotrichaceae bacterium]
MQKLETKQWLPLIGMTLAAFIFNTSEFMPIGLLTSIAAAFSISESQAGIMITAYSWAVMILSVPLMIAVSKVSFKPMLLVTLVVFAIGQILSGIAPTFLILIIARLVVASAHAIFWSVASVIAVKLVDEQHRDFAMSMIVTGTSIAMIFGLPLGRIVGLYLGWRMTFILAGIIAFALFTFQSFVFPTLDKPKPFKVNQLPLLFKNKSLVSIFIVSFLFATAYYTAYSYIEPFMSSIAKLSDTWITLSLSMFGVAGILGSVLFSKFYSKNRVGFLRLMTLNIAIVLLLLKPSTVSLISLLFVCAYWGLTSTAFNVAAQSEIILHADAAGSVAMAFFSGIFNLGIGTGSFIGGKVVDLINLGSIGYSGAVIGLLAGIYCILSTK